MLEVLYAKWRVRHAEEILKERREDQDARKEFNEAWDALEELEARYARIPYCYLTEDLETA